MKLLVACLALSCFGQLPLPELHTDAVDAGSVFRVKNNQSAPLVAYMIELLGYPGSFYTFIVDEVNGQPVKQGEERSSRVQNMTVGAVPDYVKLTAALYADGSSAGDPAKAAALVERRKAMLEATRGVITRINAAKDKKALIAELNAWADTIVAPGKATRNSNMNGGRSVVADAATALESISLEAELAQLKKARKRVGSSLTLGV